MAIEATRRLHMFRGSAARSAAAALAVGVVAGSALVWGGGVANAAPAASSHTVPYTCKVPVIGTEHVSTKLTLSVAAKASAGSTVKLKVLLQPSGLPAVAITNVTVKSTLTVSGAQKGTVTVSTHFASGNSGSLKVDLAGKLKFTKAGTVHITAGSSASFALTNSIIGKTTITCTTKSKLPVLGSVTVSKASGKKLSVADKR
jgi:hypothetical protein